MLAVDGSQLLNNKGNNNGNNPETNLLCPQISSNGTFQEVEVFSNY